jgi:hypothetical protein
VSETENQTDRVTVSPSVKWHRAMLWRAGLRLAFAVFCMASTATMLGAAVFYSHTGDIPAWLDAHGGKWAWLVFGALAGHLLLVTLPQTLEEVAGELGLWWEARHLAQVARWAPFEFPAGLDRPGTPDTDSAL